MKDIILRIRTEFAGENAPPRCGEVPLLSEEEEDRVMDQVLGPPPEEEDGDVVELTTEATWDEEDDRVTIAYEESELSGMEGTVTKITFRRAEPTLVSIIREGAFCSTLVLEQGRSHTGLYETPVMPMEVTTRAHLLQNGLTADGGTLTLDYSVRIGAITTTRTKLKMEIRPV